MEMVTVDCQSKINALIQYVGEGVEIVNENIFRDCVGQTYLVLTDDEANDMLLETIDSQPHLVSVDRLKNFLPENVDIDILSVWKDEFPPKTYNEIVNILLDCEGRKEEYIQEVFDTYKRSFFLSCDDNELAINEFYIFRVR